MNLKFIDLFSGIGGFRIAAERNGLTCVFSSEIDKFCVENYLQNFNEKPAGNIKEIESDIIPNFDVLLAGFPCQPFSYSGNLKGFEDEARGTLFFDVSRIIRDKKPKMFLLENVQGIVSHDKGRTIKTIINKLEKHGYDIHWKTLNSRDFGVPQDRKRWYCVGFDKEVNFNFPKGDNNNTTIRDILELEANDDESLKLSEFEIERIRKHFAIIEKTGDSNKRVEHDNSMYEPNTRKAKYGVFSYLKKDGSLRFHIGDSSKSQIQEAYYCNIDSYSPTIIATRSPKLWQLERYLSVRENARLQGFPENFIIHENVNQARKQFGNSVTVPVIEKIIYEMKKAYF